MYVHDEREIAEWILDGAPKALRKTASYQREQKERLVRMPAYRGLLSDDELRDLVAYWKAVAEWQMTPDDPKAAKGYEVAKASGCFSCHGPAGRGSPPNPGSFKGYIPAWDGADFEELVRDEAELEQWILDGAKVVSADAKEAASASAKTQRHSFSCNERPSRCPPTGAT